MYSKLLYFQKLKNTISEKDYDPILQSFSQQAKTQFVPKWHFIYKYKLRVDYFVILLKGKCLKLIPKPPEQLGREIRELDQMYPGLARLPNTFSIAVYDKIILNYRGRESYPRDVLNQLAEQLQKLNIPSFQMTGLLAHLIESHVVRFQSGVIMEEEEALLEAIQQKNSNCTVITIENCDILQLQIQQFLDIIELPNKRKHEKIEQLMYRAFQDGAKFPEFRRVLQELTASSERGKVCNHQSIFTSEMPSTCVYLILKGEFQVSYSSQHNHFETQEQSDTQYDKFRKTLRQDQKQVRHTVRYPIQINETTINLLKQSNKFSAREYILLKLGPGQLLGEEDFNHDCFNIIMHSFNCQCVSAKGSVLAIKKSDLYRVCIVHDWFAKLFHKRCEFKRKWLQERFETQISNDIKIDLQKQCIASEKTQKIDDSLFLRLKFLDEEGNKHKKSTKLQKTQLSPDRDLTTRCAERKQVLKKLIANNRKSNPNSDPNCIGMIQYLIKLDRHKQLLLQHSIRLAIGEQRFRMRNSSQHTQQNDQSINKSHISPQRTYSYRLGRSSSMITNVINNK